MSESIGMMDKAYFVSKPELLNWFNELLCLNLTKIEQCATGAVYCGVLDALYPGTFQFSKVRW
jgi:RP/EB family microtubule-associated protein